MMRLAHRGQRPSAAAWLVALAMTAAACGGDGESRDIETPTPTVAQPTRELLGELEQRVALFAQAEFRASYAFSMNTQEGSTAGTLTGTLTWSQQPGKARGDFAGQVGGKAVDIIVIPGPGYPSEAFLYACHRGTQRCIESRPKSEEDAYPNGEYPVVLGSVLLDGREFSEAVNVTGTSRRTVAGEEVVCFQGTGVEGASIETGEACVTEDGIVLALTRESAGQTVALTATEFSRDVGDEAFELPYPLREE